ncbi:MAG: glycosyltransferase family A protein [Phycisphaerae bacterium]|nr:glycosyltransferase family 2 protein [Phycisphaerales bacterium]
MRPHISIIVPTCGRPEALGRLLAYLGKQQLDDGCSFEVIIALDGAGANGGETVDTIMLPNRSAVEVRYLRLERVGISAAKNAAVAASLGDVLLFVNDDVEPCANFVQQHADAQAAGHRVVLGYSPWAHYPDQKIFDEMIARTRMVFFYSDLKRGHSYGFRYAWNLNLSVERSRVDRLVGPFSESLQPVFYDDVEFAHRLIGDEACVFYESNARAMHRHRFTIESYFEREALLGVMAHSLQEVNEACFRAIFSVGLDDLIRAAEHAVDHDVTDEMRALATVTDLAACRIDHPVDERLVRALYAAHLPLKRRAFRLGLLARYAAPDCDWRDYADLVRRSLTADAVMGGLSEWPSDSMVHVRAGVPVGV